MPRSTHRNEIPAPCRLHRCLRCWKPVVLLVAALPLFQTTGCFPDLLGALNFELQSLVNTTLITAVNTIIQNILGM